MPIISVNLLAGRTSEMKRALVKELAEAAVRTLGVQEQSVRVILTEVDADHWGIGTKTKSNIDEEKI